MTVFDHQAFLKSLTRRPGVYRMLNHAGDLLYVGKAKHLKNRVSTYFNSTALDAKTLALVSRIQNVEITVTTTETEALLLEQSLIQEYKPPYNILFRDDKSYPWIYLSSRDEFPRLAFHRGSRKKNGKYFGPFPSVQSVRDALNILQKAFRVRQCEDAFFKNRSRPCLQYQIKRCSGPCCGLVSPQDYADDVRHAQMFLEGKSDAVLTDYANKMEQASGEMKFEKAAGYRDQIKHLQQIQEQQYVVARQGNLDVMAVAIQPGGACVLVMFVRGGRLLGHKAFFPKNRRDEAQAETLAAFLPQFYLRTERGGRVSARATDIPTEILLSHQVKDRLLLEEALKEQSTHGVSISHRLRGHRKRWVELALINAEQSLGRYLAQSDNLERRLLALQEALSLPSVPARLECFDISHSAGEATVASCVVFNQQGPLKSDYRRFNIEGITPGDDYAAMSQALRRRYMRVKKGEGPLPDLLFIDGGKGQLSEAEKVLEELQIAGVQLIGVAKGRTRKAGAETLILPGGQTLKLPSDNPGLHLIQHIRDESHRFAITAHRQRRGKKRRESLLEQIEGVGPKRRRALLRRFGDAARVQAASAEELSKVVGISNLLAEHIYASLHNH